jgi:hypothetical protein
VTSLTDFDSQRIAEGSIISFLEKLDSPLRGFGVRGVHSVSDATIDALIQIFDPDSSTESGSSLQQQDLRLEWLDIRLTRVAQSNDKILRAFLTIVGKWLRVLRLPSTSKITDKTVKGALYVGDDDMSVGERRIQNWSRYSVYDVSFVFNHLFCFAC